MGGEGEGVFQVIHTSTPYHSQLLFDVFNANKNKQTKQQTEYLI